MLRVADLDGAAVGTPLGDRVYGWVLASTAGAFVAYTYGGISPGLALWRSYAWRRILASAIAKALRTYRSRALGVQRQTVDEIYSRIKALGLDSLARTKATLDGHIREVCEIGTGKVTSTDLTQAMTYHESLAAVLQELCARIAAGAARGTTVAHSHAPIELDLSVLNQAAADAERILRPACVDLLYVSNPPERLTDECHSVLGVISTVTELPKPAICLLGPFSSGKTFLLNHLLGDEIFSSKMEPTTAVITVIRHVGDKPAHWPAAHNVYTLRADADLRTLNLDHTTGSYDYQSLPVLTTYPEALRQEAVIVFLNKEVLQKCMFYDCPGVGTMAESTFEADSNPGPDPAVTPKRWKSIRERELQGRAIANADAYILLSSLIGGNGSFADANTGNILNAIGIHIAKSATAMPTGNLLFVGSQADPSKEGLEDEAAVLLKLQHSIQRQVEQLPRLQRQKFDLVGLRKRIVLFFALDAHQRDVALNRARMSVKRYNPDVSPPEVELAARAQVEVDLRSRERTSAFAAELARLAEEVSHRHSQKLAQVLVQELDASVRHYAAKQARYKRQEYYANLSTRYELEVDAREVAWREIVAAFEAEVDRSSATVLHGSEAIIRRWSTKQNVYDFLAAQFGYDELRPRTLAEEYADVAIEDRIKSEFDRLLLENILLPQKGTYERLLAFDEKWIERRTEEQINLDPTKLDLPKEGGIPFVNPVLTAQAFNGIAHGLWASARPALSGKPVLEALQGAALAQAGIEKAVPFKSGPWAISDNFFNLSEQRRAFNGDQHICSSLIGGRVQEAVRATLRARAKGLRQDSLAGEISKALTWERLVATDSARTSISAVFAEIKQLGIKCLTVTKGVLDWHLQEVHAAAGKGVLTPIQLRQATNFYAMHATLLREVRARVA